MRRQRSSSSLIFTMCITNVSIGFGWPSELKFFNCITFSFHLFESVWNDISFPVVATLSIDGASWKPFKLKKVIIQPHTRKRCVPGNYSKKNELSTNIPSIYVAKCNESMYIFLLSVVLFFVEKEKSLWLSQIVQKLHEKIRWLEIMDNLNPSMWSLKLFLCIHSLSMEILLTLQLLFLLNESNIIGQWQLFCFMTKFYECSTTSLCNDALLIRSMDEICWKNVKCVCVRLYWLVYVEPVNICWCISALKPTYEAQNYCLQYDLPSLSPWRYCY